MHIVKFKGWLGNQIFQYCFYQQLIEKYGKNNVYADLSYYDKIHSEFNLGYYVQLNEIRDYVEKEYLSICESNFVDYSLEINSESNCVYDGYWQSRSFFPENWDFLKDLFCIERLSGRNIVTYQLIKSTESVSVHIRRGDYVGHYKHGNIATKAYYQNAIDYCRNCSKDFHFFVFSDDIEWCKNNLNFYDEKVEFVVGNEKKEIEDLILMSFCKNNIISNSSFSWWAQEVNPNPQKKVFLPEYWYNCEEDIDELNDIENGIVIPNVLRYDHEKVHPFFSIIVPVYNIRTFVRRCLVTTLNQTYTNIEIIVVDDASTDGTYELVQHYADLDKRVKVIRQEVNESVYSARLSAIRESRGEYILFVDGDDFVEDDMCQILHRYLKRNKLDILEYGYVCEPDRTKSRISSRKVDCAESILKGTSQQKIWSRCYAGGLVRNSVHQLEKMYCNMGDDIIFSYVFQKNSVTFGRINYFPYHYVYNEEMKRERISAKDMAENLAVSIKNALKKVKRILINEYVENYKMVYSCYKKNMIHNLYQIIIKHTNDFAEQCESLLIVDKILHTSLAEMHKNDVMNTFYRKNVFINSDLKGKIKKIVKFFYSKMIKR